MPTRVPRSFRRACALGAAAAAPLFLYVLFVGRPALARYRYTSDFYDVQARRLFDGRLDVPLDRFGLEAFRAGDEYHTYFGIFPTVLRMPVLLVTDALDGRLVQPSMLLAVAVAVAGLGGLAWRVRLLLRGDEATTPVDRLDLAVAAATPGVVVLGSVVLVLSSATVVYHEAILWGVAGTLLALDRLLVVAARPTGRTILGFGGALAVAVLSRASVAFAPLVAALLLVGARGPLPGRLTGVRAVGAVRRWFGGEPDAPRLAGRAAAGLLAATLVPLLAHVAVNEARFGTPLSPPYGEQVWTEISPERRAALDANGGSLFNVGYAPSTLLAYARPDGLDLGRLFPFVHFPLDRADVLGDVTFDTRDRTASLTATSPLLVLLGLVGVAGIARDRRLAPLRGPVLGSLAAVGGVLTIGFVAHRYLGDFVPLLAVTALPGALLAAHRIASWSTGRRRAALVAAGGLAVWSLWANLGLALAYQRLFVPERPSDRTDFVATQLRIDDLLPGRIGWVAADGPPVDVAPAATFVVVGPCRELWWSDGYAWTQLEPSVPGRTPLCDELTD